MTMESQVVLFRMNNSFDYVMKEVDGIKVDERVIVTLEMLTDLEKQGSAAINFLSISISH